MGKVYIGTSENDTTAYYTFNANQQSQQPTSLAIPVYILLLNETNGEPMSSYDNGVREILICCNGSEYVHINSVKSLVKKHLVVEI